VISVKKGTQQKGYSTSYKTEQRSIKEGGCIFPELGWSSFLYSLFRISMVTWLSVSQN